MRKNYKMKKTISLKMFIAELGENFSEHMKNRLLELDVRCVLTRKEDEFKLDLKHVQHTQYNCNTVSEDTSSSVQKEYVYGQFIVNESILYFSDSCIENDLVMQSPIVNTIFDALSSEGMILAEECNAKKVDDSNIDYVIDTILTVCPQVSQAYLEIVRDMSSRGR